jgi:hypothetical protein
MLGLRSIAVGVAALAAVFGFALAAYQLGVGKSPVLLIMAAVAALLAVTLWRRLDETYVERAANSYAEAFAGALLSAKSSSNPLRSSQ